MRKIHIYLILLKMLVVLGIILTSVYTSAFDRSGIVLEKVYEPERTFVRHEIRVKQLPDGTMDFRLVRVYYLDDEDYILILDNGLKIYTSPKVYASVDKGELFIYDGTNGELRDFPQYIGEE